MLKTGRRKMSNERSVMLPVKVPVSWLNKLDEIVAEKKKEGQLRVSRSHLVQESLKKSYKLSKIRKYKEDF